MKFSRLFNGLNRSVWCQVEDGHFSALCICFGKQVKGEFIIISNCFVGRRTQNQQAIVRVHVDWWRPRLRVHTWRRPGLLALGSSTKDVRSRLEAHDWSFQWRGRFWWLTSTEPFSCGWASWNFWIDVGNNDATIDQIRGSGCSFGDGEEVSFTMYG